MSLFKVKQRSAGWEMGLKEEDIPSPLRGKTRASLLLPTSPVPEIINVTSEADTAQERLPSSVLWPT